TLRSQWREGIGIGWDGDSKAFLNQKVIFKVKRPFFSYSFSFRVTGLEPPRRFFIEYQGKPLRGRAAMEILPEENGSRVSLHWMKVEPAGWGAKFFFKLGFGMKIHRAGTMKTLRMLKDFIEKDKAGSGPDPVRG